MHILKESFILQGRMIKTAGNEGRYEWITVASEQEDETVKTQEETNGKLKILEKSTLTEATKKHLLALTEEVSNEINKKKDYYEKDENWLHEIGEKLEKKEYIQAFFSLLQVLIKGFWLSAKSGFKHLESEIQNLNLWGKTTDELKELITHFEKNIKNQNSSLSDLTDKTFLMSLCKDQVLENQCKEKSLPLPTPYDKLKYQVLTPKENQIGKVLLFNVGDKGKSNSEFWTMMKKSLLHPLTQATSGSGFQHAVMISKVDNDGEIYLTHANAKGVIEEKLDDYLARDNTMLDMMLLTPPEWYGEKAIAFAKSKLWAKYDTTGMVFDALSGARRSGEKGNISLLENKSDMFYCSELIFEGFQAAGLQAEKSLFSPGDLMKLLTPIYCASFDTSKRENHIKPDDYNKI